MVQDMAHGIDIQTLKDAVGGSAAAFRCVTDYQPTGGPGDKVFPPTYAGGKYATEERLNPETGELVKCVLLDSVQSQANRMELALLEAHRSKSVSLPLLVARFDHKDLHKKFVVTSLEASHRAADAVFRDSCIDGKKFRESEKGRHLDLADVRNATGLFGICPTALVFGLWDSTGPRGGSGTKFQRALVSEIIGYDATPGVTTASRIDRPLDIVKQAGPVYRTESGDWTLDPDSAEKKKGNPVLYQLGPKGQKSTHKPSADKAVPDRGRPSVINHGNVTPDYSIAKDPETSQIIYEKDEHGRELKDRPRILGGFTISKAVQTTTLSLAVLRRLRFPLNNEADSEPDVDLAARTALAALGLAAGTLAREDVDLRSRCHLFADEEPVWELLDIPGAEPKRFRLASKDALKLLSMAIDEAKESNLPWEGEMELVPSGELVELVKRSQDLAINSSESKEGD